MADPRADVWAWVMSHGEAIQNACRSLWYPKLGVELNDFKHALLLDLHDKAAGFDCTRGSAGAYVWWRAKAVRLRIQRECSLEDADRITVISTASDDERWADRVFTYLLISDVLALATPEQIEAANSVLLGLSNSEVRQRLSVSLTARNARLYRLGSKFREQQLPMECK